MEYSEFNVSHNPLIQIEPQKFGEKNIKTLGYATKNESLEKLFHFC